MAEHILTIMADAECNYSFRVVGTVEPVFTGYPASLVAEDDVWDTIDTQPDGTVVVEGRTGAIASPGSAWYGDTYRIEGSVEEFTVSLTAGGDSAILLDGESVTRADVLALDDTEPPPDGEEPPPADESFVQQHPVLAGVAIGMLTQAVLRAVGD